MDADATFERDGYLGPVTLLTRGECRSLAAYLRRADVPAPPVWEKARAAHERRLYDLATRPSLLEPVTSLIGPDVVLWGISAVARAPGQAHPWHSDIESCGAEGGFVSVWIGVENTSRDSSLQLIAGSHRLGASVQEARVERGIARDDTTPEQLLQLARERSAAVELVEPEMGDGEAIFFDGRLWHGTDNRQRRGERLALLLQFAAADRAVRIPDWDELDWPFRIRTDPLPPVIRVSGSSRNGVNHTVPPPPQSPGDPIASVVHALDLPLGDGSAAEPWRPFPAFRGPTVALPDMSCHASVLAGGHSPHPLHAHDEEELLIPLHGEAELVIAESADGVAPQLQRVAPGAFVYYPARQHHTIQNPGSSPIGYLMFKWRTSAAAGAPALGTRIVRYDDVSTSAAEPFSTRLLLEGPTDALRLLHSHLTVLQPGAGYEPHRDEHDVAIVVLDGVIETLGQRIAPLSVVYCSAGDVHGMRNPGPEPARYLVFEFHAVHGARPDSRTSPVRRIASKLRRARARRP